MTNDEFHIALTARPFRPFLIRMTDGAAFDVAHPEFVAHRPASLTAYHSREDGGIEWLDLMHVTGLEFDPVAKNGRS